MRLTLAEGNKLEVTELPIRDVGSGMGSETDSCDRRHTAVFDLMMTVSHVKETWMETPGNLVTHIRVGVHLSPSERSELFFFSWLLNYCRIQSKCVHNYTLYFVCRVRQKHSGTSSMTSISLL